MARGIVIALGIALGVAPACGDDGDGSGSTAGMTTAPTAGSTGATMDDGAGTTAAPAGTSTGGPADGTSTSGGSTTQVDLDGFVDEGGPMCSTNVQGEWNACVDSDGNTDLTLCNFLGDSDANGFIGCLNSAEQDGATSCFINGCMDVCDCLPPPATGTAVVVCDAILEGGGMGCALDCGSGEACPDGMECLGSICFWPAGA